MTKSGGTPTPTGPVVRLDKGQPGGGRYTFNPNTDGDVDLQQPEDDWEPDEFHGRRFSMPDTALPKAIIRIERANTKLAKAGIEERFTYEVEESIRTREGRSVAIATITLNRPAISFAGWSFSGAHDLTPDGSIISNATGPDTPVVEDAHCDHCGTNRRRERVYTLHSDTDGDKQVGKSCLSAFLGVKPEGLWALDSDLDLDEGDDEDGGRAWLSSGSQMFPADELLAMAIAASDGGENFVSRSRETHEHPATADKVLGSWNTLRDTVTEDDEKLAKEIRSWVRNLDAGDNDYLLNLKAALIGKGDEGEHWVKRKHVPLAVSAIAAYQHDRAEVIVKETRATEKASFAAGFVADEGTKISAVPATVLRSHVIDGGTYGGRQTDKTIVTMISDDGHQMTWFASGDKSFKTGAKVLVAGTVKNHDRYDDADQTVITRAKLTDPETGEKLGDD